MGPWPRCAAPARRLLDGMTAATGNWATNNWATGNGPQVGRGGGYILAASHTIPPETPDANIFALYDEAEASPAKSSITRRCCAPAQPFVRSSTSVPPPLKEHPMTPRDEFIAAWAAALRPANVPHFDWSSTLRWRPSARSPTPAPTASGTRWRKRRALHRNEMADIYIQTAERYEHNAIFIHPNPGKRGRGLSPDRTDSREIGRPLRHRETRRHDVQRAGGDHMQAFAYRLVDRPEKVHAEAAAMVDKALAQQNSCLPQDRLGRAGGLDGFALCADYCFNTGPFLSPRRFAEFVTPYLATDEGLPGPGVLRDQAHRRQHHAHHRSAREYPTALHSIDPQAGVDIAEVKRRYGDRICLIGNVNCGMLDTGTDEVIASAAMPSERDAAGATSLNEQLHLYRHAAGAL